MRYFLLIIFLKLNLYAQDGYYQSQLDLDKKIITAKKTDSVIQESKNYQNKSRTKILTSILEGSSQISKKNDRNKLIKQSVIGSGGFSNYTYRVKKTNELIKIRSGYTIHLNKKAPSVNSERIEVDIYFENQIPYLSKIIENHYTEKEVISSNRYFVNLPKKRKIIDKTHFSNEFQLDLLKYIYRMIDDVTEIN